MQMKDVDAKCLNHLTTKQQIMNTPL